MHGTYTKHQNKAARREKNTTSSLVTNHTVENRSIVYNIEFLHKVIKAEATRIYS